MAVRNKKVLYAAVIAVLAVSATGAIFVFGGDTVKNVFYNTSEITINVTSVSQEKDTKIWIYVDDHEVLGNSPLEPGKSLETKYDYQTLKLKKDHEVTIKVVSCGGDAGAGLDFKKVTVGSGQNHAVHMSG